MPITERVLHPKYDRQIIFILADYGQSDLMGYERILAKSGKYDYRNGSIVLPLIASNDNKLLLSPEILQACQTVTKETRIYIRSHCDTASPELFTDKKLKIRHEYLARFLVTHFRRSSNIFLKSNEKLKISLIGCCSGLANKAPAPPGCINNSFAAQFSKALHDLGVDAAIAARLGYVSVNDITGTPRFNVIVPTKINSYHKFEEKYNNSVLANSDSNAIADLEKKMIATFYDPRAPEAKVIYQYNREGCQEMISPYKMTSDKTLPLAFSEQTYTWRDEVIDAINECILETHSSDKKLGLANLRHYCLSTTSDQKIRLELRTELASCAPGKYHVNSHSNFMSSLRGEKTRTHIRLQKLL